MKIDDEMMARGSRVFCLALGEGSVVELPPAGGCVVSFDGDDSRQTYSDQGVSPRFARRTLYMRAPVITPVPQMVPTWMDLYNLDAAAMKARYEQLSGDQQ